MPTYIVRSKWTAQGLQNIKRLCHTPRLPTIVDDQSNVCSSRPLSDQSTERHWIDSDYLPDIYCCELVTHFIRLQPVVCSQNARAH